MVGWWNSQVLGIYSHVHPQVHQESAQLFSIKNTIKRIWHIFGTKKATNIVTSTFIA